MWDLEFVATGDEFATVPETAGRFHGQDIDGAGKKAYYPARDPVEQDKAVLGAISVHVNKFERIIFG
jgi:hypothetical protein